MSRTVRQKERLMAQDHLMRRREALAPKETKISEQVLDPTAAVLDRDRDVGESERRIAHAVHGHTVTEALPMSKAAECGLDIRAVNRVLRGRARGTMSVREANPLSQNAGITEKG